LNLVYSEWKKDENQYNQGYPILVNNSPPPSMTHHQSTPTPTKYTIKVHSQNLIIEGITQTETLKIYNLQGKLIQTQSIKPAQNISTHHLPKGLYIARLHYQNFLIKLQ